MFIIIYQSCISSISYVNELDVWNHNDTIRNVLELHIN